MESHRRKKYMSAAYRSSFARLMLNFYLYHEGVREGYQPSEKETEAAKDFCRILEGFLEGEEEREALFELRDRIIAQVQVLTAFVDCFQIYEYVLNRMERRFLTMPVPEIIPAKMAEKIIEKIGSFDNPVQQSETLKRIVAQLPVRLTRGKFYSIVLERLSVFNGLEQSGIENFLYMLETTAMVRLPEHMDQEPDLYQVLQTLEQTDYRRMDGVNFGICSGTLARGIRIVTGRTDQYMLLARMVNDLSVLFLSGGEALTDAVEEQDFRKGIARILEAVKNQESLSEEETQEILGRTEGVQESMADVIDGGTETGDDLVLEKIGRLLSGSNFMPLEEEEVSHETADQAFIEDRARKFCEELERLFENMPKAVVRGVMAKVLSGLPMVWKEAEELEEYIRTSLEGCTDYAEREACMELLEQELMD